MQSTRYSLLTLALVTAGIDSTSCAVVAAAQCARQCCVQPAGSADVSKKNYTWSRDEGKELEEAVESVVSDTCPVRP